MDKTILDTLYNYFNSILKSALGYSNIFLFPASPSDDLVSFGYSPLGLGPGNFSSILRSNPQVLINLKTQLKSLFSRTYDNINTINLIFDRNSFSIKINFDVILPQEIYGLIVPHLSTGESIKSWRETSQHFKRLVSQKMIDAHTNHLWTLIILFPNKKWDWFEISRNPNITMDIIRDNPNKPSASARMPSGQLSKESWPRWDWFYISNNPNITWEMIRDNPDKPWNWYGISMNPNITRNPLGCKDLTSLGK